MNSKRIPSNVLPLNSEVPGKPWPEWAAGGTCRLRPQLRCRRTQQFYSDAADEADRGLCVLRIGSSLERRQVSMSSVSESILGAGFGAVPGPHELFIRHPHWHALLSYSRGRAVAVVGRRRSEGPKWSRSSAERNVETGGSWRSGARASSQVLAAVWRVDW